MPYSGRIGRLYWLALETCNGVASHSLSRLQRWHAARFKARNGVGTLKQLPTFSIAKRPQRRWGMPVPDGSLRPAMGPRARNYGVEWCTMNTLHEGR